MGSPTHPAQAPPTRTPAQNRRMWGAVSKLRRAAGLDEDDVASMLRERTRRISGQDHTSQLTERQMGRLIDELEAELRRYAPTEAQRAKPVKHRWPQQGAMPPKVDHEPWAPREGGAREQAPITLFQKAMISRLVGGLGWTEDHARAFSARQCGTPWPQTQVDADKLIEPLQAMLVRQANPADVLARARALLGHPKVDEWERTKFLPGLVKRLVDAEAAKNMRRALTAEMVLKLREAERRAGVAS